MENTPTQHMTLIVFGGVLLAAIIVGVIMYFSSSFSSQGLVTQSTTDMVPLAANTATQFDTTLFQRTEYKQLDMSLFVRGLLPVVPPAGTGKANIFR